MTQGELEKIPNKIVKAMNDLEIRIMDDIVRRIKINGFSTAGADWQFDRLQQLGMSEKEIKDWVRQTLDVTDKEIDKIFSDEVYEQYMKHSRGYEAYGREQIPFDENIELQQLIEAVKRQANEELERITGSMGFVRQGASGKMTPIELSDFYTQTLDSAMYDIHSGAFDYNTVLKRTIEDMTKSGLRWIDYESGWHNRVPVAARRAVMTGFRQVQGKINEQTAEALGTDSYEVTVHIGARPTHQVWEGKIWTMTQLRTVCGLGEVTGLHGANCYHDYNPFIPGVDVPAYSQEELDQIHKQENTPKRYNGKEYTTYEALQRQRKLETRARKYREDVHLLEEGGGSEDDIIAKKCRYQGTLQEYRDFSKKMDLPMQKERIYQDGLKVDMNLKAKQEDYMKDKGLAKANALFVNKNERLFKNAGKIKKLPEYEDFTCHATPDVFQIDLVGNGDEKDFIDLTPQEYAKRIKNSGAYKGGKIRIISCQAGAKKNGAAQKLADALGVDVLAPTEVVNVDDDGNIFLTDNDILAQMWYTSDDKDSFHETGSWKVFHPKEKDR